jgi:hypothetical protein
VVTCPLPHAICASRTVLELTGELPSTDLNGCAPGRTLPRDKRNVHLEKVSSQLRVPTPSAMVEDCWGQLNPRFDGEARHGGHNDVDIWPGCIAAAVSNLDAPIAPAATSIRHGARLAFGTPLARKCHFARIAVR